MYSFLLYNGKKAVIEMKRMFLLLCALMLAFGLSPVRAENALPAEVQAYYDVFVREMADWGVDLSGSGLEYCEDAAEYAQNLPGIFFPQAASRVQYDAYYYRNLSDNCALTVCMREDRALAYILDFELINFVAARTPTFEAIEMHTASYAAWQKSLGAAGYNGFSGANLLENSGMLEHLYGRGGDAHDKLTEWENVYAAVMVPYLTKTASLVIYPKAAYEGLTVEGEAWTAEKNHTAAVMFSLLAEQNMLENYLETH